MNERSRRSYPGEWLGLSAGLSGAAIALYYGFMAGLPACGPPRNSWLGRLYFVVPIAILIVEGFVPVAVGQARSWQTRRTVACVLLAIVVTVIGGFVVWFLLFAAGDCGE